MGCQVCDVARHQQKAMRSHRHTNMHTHAGKQTHIHMLASMRACTYTDADTSAHTHTHTYAGPHAHTHTCDIYFAWVFLCFSSASPQWLTVGNNIKCCKKLMQQCPDQLFPCPNTNRPYPRKERLPHNRAQTEEFVQNKWLIISRCWTNVFRCHSVSSCFWLCLLPTSLSGALFVSLSPSLPPSPSVRQIRDNQRPSLWVLTLELICECSLASDSLGLHFLHCIH